MKEKMIEFLLKRLGSKVDDLKGLDGENYELLEHVSSDIDVYVGALKDLLKEVILP